MIISAVELSNIFIESGSSPKDWENLDKILSNTIVTDGSSKFWKAEKFD